MSAEKKDGGLAFPSRRYEPASIEDPFEEPVRVEYPGLTIRDWFAGQAMAGLMANSGGPVQRNEQCGWRFTNCGPEDVAREAYGMADSMLKAREA